MMEAIRKIQESGDDNRNYFFKDGKAYTEDGVLVHNLFIYKVPQKVTQEDVLKYFTVYGLVKKVHLISDKKRSRRSAPKVGYVHFADSLVAAEVLKKTHHLVQSKRIFVKACDSWHQTVSTEDSHMAVVEEQISQSSSATLLQLNDDCLEHICKKLKLRDQVSFARSCTRFCNVFQMCCKLEYKTLVLDRLEGMTLWGIREFFKLAGSNIETLMGSVPFKDRDRIIDLIRRDCVNIRCINLDTSKIKSASLRKLFANLKNVTELKLNDCAVKDNAIWAIKELQKLETLHLTENYDLTGKHLHMLKNLKELSLSGCGNIQSTYMTLVLQSLTDLRHLNIQRCERMNSAVFNVMAMHCKNLEVLKMSCASVQYECVARLPRLRHLELSMLSRLMPVRQELFVQLAEHKANQLEYLKIIAKNSINSESAAQIARLKQLKTLICPNSEYLKDDCLRKFAQLENLEELVIKNCRNVSNDGLLYLLRKCTKLRRINLQFCSNITHTFVYKAIEILKNMDQNAQQKRKEPLLLYVTKTGINEFVLLSTPYSNASALLELSFQVPLSMGLEENDLLNMLEFLADDEYDLDDSLDDEIDDIYDVDEDMDVDDLYLFNENYSDDEDDIYDINPFYEHDAMRDLLEDW